MKMLFCSPGPLVKSLGATKVLVELVEAMRDIGCDCTLVSPSDMGASGERYINDRSYHAEILRAYLRKYAGNYDLVDYDHEVLPYSRSEFSRRSLFVARSVLLVHHLSSINIPSRDGLRGKIGRIVKGASRIRIREERIARAQLTINQADLVNVCNSEDKDELIRRGVPADKIIVIPFGISRARRSLFDAIPNKVPEHPVVVFVGTFDYRKGASDFPIMAQQITESIPNVKFRLLGTRGLYKTEKEVLSVFPKRLADRIEVLPQFDPGRLPSLLHDCSVGVFPSYLEGFPFGVLEMLAASIPVVAYRSPGAPMMLPEENLVPPGDTLAMASKVSRYLLNKEELMIARLEAQQRSQEFCWSTIAEITKECYSRNISKLKS